MKKIIGAGGGCFLGDTLVYTVDGEKRIDALKEGDYIVSFDDKGKFHKAKILAVHVHEDEEVYRFTYWGGGYLDATPNHWVLNQFNAFVCIGSLGTDDCLIDRNNHLRPIIGRTKLENGTVYNLTVENQHTFIAGGIRVHNAGLGTGAIYGAGGGSKGSGGGDTADDTLNSITYVSIIDLLSEGEIEGFPSAAPYARDSVQYLRASLKDVYLDGTAVMKASANVDKSEMDDSDYNFNELQSNDFDIRWGTVDQTYIPGFTGAENAYSVGITVTEDSPVIRTITNENVDRVKVTLSWPALQIYQDDGDIEGLKVEYKISISYNGGAYITKVDSKVDGRTGDLYEKTHTIAFDDASKEFPVDIKVVRQTDDPSSKEQSEFSWSSYTEIVDAKLRYPNSALISIKANGDNFDSIPTRAYKIRGIKVSIPSNATVDATNGRLTYEGVWDGTFGAAQWTSDPCWCLWDLLTNCRYGFGQNIPSRTLDKWSFYQASVYCNELVKTGGKNDDGSDEYEPRFSCNVCINAQDEAYKVINDMCSIFRAMPYWGAGTLIIAQDSPSAPVYLFNQTNISEDGFQYNGTSLKTRSTVAVVKYFDIDLQDYDYVSVEDQAGIAKYGVITASVEAFACTSISQARRVGEWLLYTQQYETETITFKTSIDGGIGVRPGMVIATSDPLRAGVRRGGRIRAAGTNYIVIDEPLATDIPNTASPKVYVSMIDGTVEQPTVASTDGAKITINGSFVSTPLVGGVFIYSNDQMKKELWRVLSVKEDNGTEYQITALSHNPTKYDYIERDVELNTKVYTPLEVVTPKDPSNISSTSIVYESSGQLSNKVVTSWENDSNAVQYSVKYRLVG